MRVSVVVVGVLLGILHLCNGQDCSFTDSQGVVYDFSPLQARYVWWQFSFLHPNTLRSEFYVFAGGVAKQDRLHRGHHGEKYLYYVNFCKNIDKQKLNESACLEKPNTGAYQVGSIL